MSRFILGIPTLCRYDLLERLLAGVPQSTLLPREVCVIDNGRSFTPPASYPIPLTVVRPPHNLGVAASWNLLGRMYRPADLVMCNDDVAVHRDSFSRLLAADADLVIGDNFSFFLQREGAWRAIGEYDEEFWPAYWEDTDYTVRIQRLGAAVRTAQLPPLVHHDTSSTGCGTLAQAWFERNGWLFANKWGLRDPAGPLRLPAS